MRVLITTGGTGGHIYPALSLMKELESQYDTIELQFVGSSNRMEAIEVPKRGYNYKAIEVHGLSGSILNKLKAAGYLIKGYRESKKIVKKFNPDIVIGFGNYISVPVVLAAHRLGIKTMIHEQNSHVGKANKFLGRFVDAIVGSYDENLNEFPKDKTRILGNPRASEASQVVKDETILAELGLDPNKQTVLCVMGSLGSDSINSVLKESIPKMADQEYQVLIVAGNKGYSKFMEGLELPSNIKVVPYIDGVRVMKQVDLIVARAGATTAAEIVEMNIPSILIPSPYVPNDHQTKNAQTLKNAGACEMIKEKDLTTLLLCKEIDGLIKNKSRLNEMSKASVQLSHAFATKEMILWIEELIGESNG